MHLDSLTNSVKRIKKQHFVMHFLQFQGVDKIFFFKKK